MSWLQVLDLLQRWGPDAIALIAKLWKLIKDGKEPTQEDWDALAALSKQTATSKMTDALTKAGIPLDSPNALALLALTKTNQ